MRPRRRHRPALPKDAGWNVSAFIISLCASDVTLYISNNRINGLSRVYESYLRKLQLARFQWTIFEGDSKFKQKVELLATSLREVIREVRAQDLAETSQAAAADGGKLASVY